MLDNMAYKISYFANSDFVQDQVEVIDEELR